MLIVQPTVSLEFITPNAEELIEAAGRTAHQSHPKGTPKEFIQKLKKMEHMSVFEHAYASFRIVCDRGLSHELVRHRIASFTQESTRYVDYKGEITVVCPPGLGEQSYKHWMISCQEAERAYALMREGGVSPQFARSVLPTCLKTEIVITANFREWMHIITLRTSAAAHPQMSALIIVVQDILNKSYPSIFDPPNLQNPKPFISPKSLSQELN